MTQIRFLGDTIYFNPIVTHFPPYSYNVSSAKTTQVTHSKVWTSAGPVRS
jgi:hypothetical protein